MDRLVGKTCVVTGGASGIGLALARRFSAAGMNVVLGDIDADAVTAAAAALGPQALGVPGDVTAPESMLALREAAVARFGGVHVVCLNAGVSPTGPLLQTPLSSWRWVFDVNVFGVVNGVLAFAPGLVAQGDGHIVFTASALGLHDGPGFGAYSASKHAVVGLAGALREELAGSGVGVSAVCPGFVRTRLLDSERTRPAALDGVTHVDPQQLQDLRAQMAVSAAEPAVIADAAHDAVLADEPFALPNPGVYPRVERRIDGLLAAMRRDA